MDLRRRLGLLLPGTRERRRQIVDHAEAWDRSNRSAEQDTPGGPVWVVLGDSTAQAIGATAPDRGYVGLVRAWLEQRDARPWRVRNLSVSGARAADVVSVQLPLVEAVRADLVSCAIGANDLLRRSRDLELRLATIAGALPPGSLLANLPRGLREGDATRVNARIAALTADHGLRLVDLWSVTGPPWRGKYAADMFHPSDLGYQDWANAFIDAART